MGQDTPNPGQGRSLPLALALALALLSISLSQVLTHPASLFSLSLSLSLAENITEFAKHLNLTQKNMQAALSKFLALDTDGNGYIDKKEFASIFKLNAQCATTTHMFDSIGELKCDEKGWQA